MPANADRNTVARRPSNWPRKRHSCGSWLHLVCWQVRAALLGGLCGRCTLYLCIGIGRLVCGVCFGGGGLLPFRPLPGPTYFLCLAKESRQRKGAPEMATPSLNFHKRAETGKTRFAQTVSRLFSAHLQKFKAPSRAERQKKRPTPREVGLVVWASAQRFWLLTFLPYAAP
jgi:hypothetical protein